MDWEWGTHIGGKDTVSKAVLQGREDRDLNSGSGIEEKEKWMDLRDI